MATLQVFLEIIEIAPRSRNVGPDISELFQAVDVVLSYMVGVKIHGMRFYRGGSFKHRELVHWVKWKNLF